MSKQKKEETKLQVAQRETEETLRKTNAKIGELGECTKNLSIVLNSIQKLFDELRNIPSDKKIEYEKLRNVHLEWKQQADKIKRDFHDAIGKNVKGGTAGVFAAMGFAAYAPTAAMGIATTFGVASTGTPIAALSGAAATNAALAWLGGGTLLAGGGGMVAGKFLLALAGPIGWAISGFSLISSGVMIWKAKKEKERLEDIYTLIAKRDTKSYKLAIVELNQRIIAIKKEIVIIEKAIEEIKTFGTDYEKMTEEQQYKLGTYLNLMLASTQLLVNPILGLQPKYNESDYNKFALSCTYKYLNKETIVDLSDILMKTDLKYKDAIITLCNLLYKIELNDKDRNVLVKAFKNNKEMLSSMNMKKKEFEFLILENVEEALKYKYGA